MTLRVALVAVLLVPLAPSTQGQGVPDFLPKYAGPSPCANETASTFVCNWNKTIQPGTEGVWYWTLPKGITTSLIDVTIATDAIDRYAWHICDDAARGPCDVIVGESPPPGATPSRTNSTVLADLDPWVDHVFVLAASMTAASSIIVAPQTFHIEGRFHQVTRRAPAGGHAGTRDDPQLHDGPGDSKTRSGDIVGGWFDQPYLDDGLVQVGLAVPNIGELPSSEGDQSQFDFTFHVLGQTWTVSWRTNTGPGSPATTWVTTLTGTSAPQRRIYIPTHVSATNHTLTTLLPLATLGSPREDDLFTNFTAASYRSAGEQRAEPTVPDATRTVDDTAESRVRDFAIGGPAVWDALRGLPAPTASGPGAAPASWLAAPLSRSNAPLTFGFASITLVLVGGVVGFAFLRRRLAHLPVEHAPPIAPGATVLAKYRIIRELGAGGGGHAFLAEDVRMKRNVVLKTISGADRAAAIREARSAASIDHPNVVRVYDVEEIGAQGLIVMEYVDGGSLKERILSIGALSDASFARVMDDLLAALSAVHEAGAVHRDVKPGNVLLTRDGHAKLSDFGVARLPGFETTLGTPVIGSVQYMAPEQARGRRVTPRSDLYSAAVTLFEARAGFALVTLVDGESAVDTQMRVGAGIAFDRDVEPPALRAWFARACRRARGALCLGGRDAARWARDAGAVSGSRVTRARTRAAIARCRSRRRVSASARALSRAAPN